MASIDALSQGTQVPTKPAFNLNDNDFGTLKSVKEVATLEEQRWKDLLHAVHSFVADHLDECSFTPRNLKKGPYSILLALFLDNGGSDLWGSDREGYQRGSHLVWPDDQEKIRCLAFALIKQEAAKQCAKKRKESGADDKDNASNASSPPPPQAKKPKMMELSSKKDPAAKVGNAERQSLFGSKTTTNGFKDPKDMRTPGTPLSNDDMQDSIVVGDIVGLQPAKKTAAGDPFTRFRDVNKLLQGEPASPSPAPKPVRKPATKPAVKEASGLKFDVSAPAPKHSNGTPRGKEAVKAAPSDKVGDGKGAVKQPATKTPEAAGKSMKQVKKLNPQGKAIQEHSEVAVPEQQEKGEVTMSGVTVTAPDEQYQEHIRHRSPDLTDTINVFTPDADGLQATIEVDQVKIKPDLVDNATITVHALHEHATAGVPVAKRLEATNKQMKAHTLTAGQQRSAGAHPKHAGFETVADKGGSIDAEEASSENDVGVTEKNGESEEVANEDRKLSVGSTRTMTPGVSLPNMSPVAGNNNIAATAAAAASAVTPTPQSHVFIITVSQPEDPGTDTESICLTFPPTTTNWASFYCSLAMQLPVEGRVAFAMATTCKIRVPRKGQRKSRVFGFEMKQGVTDTIWANVMRMVAGLGEDSEPVEVEFFD